MGHYSSKVGTASGYDSIIELVAIKSTPSPGYGHLLDEACWRTNELTVGETSTDPLKRHLGGSRTCPLE